MTRWYRPLMLGLTVAILGVGAAIFWTLATGWDAWGLDYGHYLDATRRWLAQGTPYLASEVAAPFQYQPLTFLHPPLALLLFTPFLVLPAIAWWAIPVGLVAWAVWSMRPAPWAWPLLALALAYPRFQGALIVGNTDLWVMAGVALGLRTGWHALLIFAKPSLAFMALAGARWPSFWRGLPVVALLAIPFGLLWIDWLRVIFHAPGGVGYSLMSVPFLLAPVVAYTARSRQ